MFGLFRKKKDTIQENLKETPQADPAEFLELVSKWDGFLLKIENRFTESLVNAEEALMDNLVESDYDIQPTMVAWAGIKSQLRSLVQKIDHTFDEKVLPQMLEYKEHHALLGEAAKGTRLGESIYDRIERFELILEGKISSLFYKHAIGELNKEFKCTQCSAKIEVRKDIFHAHYVSCDYCNTVNTFTPNDKIFQIRWVVGNISKHKALVEWDKMKEAEDSLREYRQEYQEGDSTKIALFKDLEMATHAFWLRFYTERSGYLPQYASTIDADVENKMKWFYEKRQQELNF